MQEYPEELVPVIVGLLQESQSVDVGQLLQMDQRQSLPIILKKEAIYNAVCVGQFVLYGHVDWNGLLQSTLLAVGALRHFTVLGLPL